MGFVISVDPDAVSSNPALTVEQGGRELPSAVLGLLDLLEEFDARELRHGGGSLEEPPVDSPYTLLRDAEISKVRSLDFAASVAAIFSSCWPAAIPRACPGFTETRRLGSFASRTA